MADTYRPDYYRNYIPPPPPPSSLPPLPPGPPPPYNKHRGDSWKPEPNQNVFSSGDFSFRNSDSAPQYPRHRDFGATSAPKKPRKAGRDTERRNFNRRGNDHQRSYGNRVGPSDRPLLKLAAENNTSQRMLGATSDGASRFVAMEDLSDSDEEQMDESASEDDPNDHEDTSLDTKNTNDDQLSVLEPPLKRRALVKTSRTAEIGATVPKWSNPDPYTVLPPIDEAQRKRKDVVRLIRKARKDAEEKAAVTNQVTANDDFISFGVDDDEESVASSSVDKGKNLGEGVPGAPLGPREFSHRQNLHGEHAPGTSGSGLSTTNLGPPPVLVEPPHISSEEIVLDYDHAPLGSRKRTHEDVIKDGANQPQRLDNARKKGPGAALTGSILPEFAPNNQIDCTPWLHKGDYLTANAGFRLHKEICDFFEFVRPQKFEQIVRDDLLSRLQKCVNQHLPNCNVHCFGSFAAGLYLPTADMDIVIISNSFRSSRQKVVCQTRNQMYRFGQFLRSSRLAIQDSVEVIHSAKVPIVKFVDRLTSLKVDISFENDTGVIANKTFAIWKEQFPAMPVLVMVIKQFLMMRGLNEVMHGGLGGFSVTCLVTSLLQNMPRIQTGDLVPEQHLGEMLLEFLDFYGNRLDTKRAGIQMNPPGYFDKQAYERSNLRGPTYQGNKKADRLAIIDPNNPLNDISGGSREVMRIFDRFSRAHAEILVAMKALNRPSLLDWLLGGNYESFFWQRNHLSNLYRQTWGDQNVSGSFFVGEKESRNLVEPLTVLRGGSLAVNPPVSQSVDALQKIDPNAMKLDTDTKGSENAPPKSSAKTAAEAARNSKKATKKAKLDLISRKAVLHAKQAARAAELKKQYPDMKDVPERIGTGLRKKLIAEYAAKHGLDQSEDALKKERIAQNLKAKFPELRVPQQAGRKKLPKLINKYVASGGVVNQSAGSMSKGERKAQALRALYPDMGGIPHSITKAERKKLVSTYKNKRSVATAAAAKASAGPVLRKSTKLASENSRLAATLPTPLRMDSTYPTRQHARLHGSSEDASFSGLRPQKKGVSNKMAPLSDARRAEVARNFQGLSEDDPISID